MNTRLSLNWTSLHPSLGHRVPVIVELPTLESIPVNEWVFHPTWHLCENGAYELEFGSCQTARLPKNWIVV